MGDPWHVDCNTFCHANGDHSLGVTLDDRVGLRCGMSRRGKGVGVSMYAVKCDGFRAMLFGTHALAVDWAREVAYVRPGRCVWVIRGGSIVATYKREI
jgi:hypothetical protein